MIRSRCDGLFLCTRFLGGCCLAVWLVVPVSAQPPTAKPKMKPLGVLEVKRLDAKTEEIRQSFSK